MRATTTTSLSSPSLRLLSLLFVLLAAFSSPASAVRKYRLSPRQSSGDLIPCSEQDLTGSVCCSDGYTTCPDTDTCGIADNGVIGCCPIGETCSGDASIDTDTVFSDQSTAFDDDDSTSSIFGGGDDFFSTSSSDDDFFGFSTDDSSFSTPTLTAFGGGGGGTSDDFFPTPTRGGHTLPPLPTITQPGMPPPPRPGAGARAESLSLLQLGALALIQAFAGMFI